MPHTAAAAGLRWRAVGVGCDVTDAECHLDGCGRASGGPHCTPAGSHVMRWSEALRVHLISPAAWTAAVNTAADERGMFTARSIVPLAGVIAP